MRRRRLTARIHERLHTLMEEGRLLLARPDALVALSLLGLFTGLAAGVLILAFRMLVEGSQGAALEGGSAENYESLPPGWRLALPILSALAIALLFERIAGGPRVLGVPRVLERITYHQGYISLREFVLQFLGAAIAIVGGHSVGREGPHVFLGAAAGSQLAQRLALPNNSIRTLVGCGVAAGIAASFNTPLAGVAFALEVVLAEYTLASFIPMILAAVSADALCMAVFGHAPALRVPPWTLGALTELPLLLLLGLLAGGMAALFARLVQVFTRVGRRFSYRRRLLLAGLVTGLCAIPAPQIMGLGYDTVNLVLLGQMGSWSLLFIITFKLVATSAGIGLGVPGGTIGPSIFLGACLGGLYGHVVQTLLPGMTSGAGFYALIGMGAVLAASLQAPLAALTALLELTQHSGAIMPAMLAVVTACIASNAIFGESSLVLSVLKANGMAYDANPIRQALRRVGVASVMDPSLIRLQRVVSVAKACEQMKGRPSWVIVDLDNAPRALMPGVDLVHHLEALKAAGGVETEVDLLEIPARREDLASVNLQATLQEAAETLERKQVAALYVERMTAPGIRRVYGVITREHVNRAYGN